MYRNLLLFLFVSLTAFGLQAQVIYSEPAFPTAEDEVTLFFNATEGNGGLADCNCEVYLHTGVITNLSNSPTDWRYVPTQWGVPDDAWRMTPVAGEDNLYSFTYSPSVRAYFGVPASETIEFISLVFRNGDGSQTGRAEDGSDIYLEIFENTSDFIVQLQSPAAGALIVEAGETIPVRVAATQEATFTVTDNGALLTEQTTELLEFSLTAGEAGTHLVEITAASGDNQQNLSFSYTVPLDLASTDPPPGLEPGIAFRDGKLQLALYAPGKEHIFVLGSFNDYLADTEYQMTPSDDGTWWIEAEGLDENATHTFQYLVDGNIRIADPYSTIVLDPREDPFISDATYPALPAYPAGAEGIVTLLQPEAVAYEWQVNDFIRPDKEDLVIYELLLRDFVATHDYQTLVDTLGYLKNLGVNAIELMPIQEFEGNISWGYNPSYHMALDKYYGRIRDFKYFVDACHAVDIAVIVDVVYNHAFSQSPLAQLYWDAGSFRPSPDNPWLNVTARHPFNVGFDFNHESAATQSFVKRVMRYWLEEMRVDGFRFDLSKGFTQRNTPDDVGAWGAYDASRIALLKSYADEVWDAAPGAYVILEHFAANQEEEELVSYGEGMMVWNNMTHDYQEAAMGYNSNLNGSFYTSRGWDAPYGLVTYMESHDEERLMYKNLEFGNSSGSYNVKNLETALRRIEAASAFFYTIPGPKMLWQFGELGYEFSINYCEDGTINENCRTGPKPIRWDYFQQEARRRLYEVTRTLIQTRNNYEVFQTNNFSSSLGGMAKKIFLDGEDMDLAALANFGVTTEQLSAPFPSAGTWYELFSRQALEVTDPNAAISLQPGEYRIYTSEPVDYAVSTEEAPKKGSLSLKAAPNPSHGPILLTYELPVSDTANVEIFSMQGQPVYRQLLGKQASGWHALEINADLPAGAYVLKLTAGSRFDTRTLIVK